MSDRAPEQILHDMICERCRDNKPPFEPKPDVQEWIQHKLTDPSWAKWRAENPDWVKKHGAPK